MYLLIGSILVLGWFLYHLYHSVIHRLPLPLIGHTPWVILCSRQKLLERMDKVTQRMGGRTWDLMVPGMGRAWVVEDPTCVKHVLSTRHDAFGKGEFAGSKMRELFGDGIVIATGSSWKLQRLAGNQAFNRPGPLTFFAEKILGKHVDVLLSGFENVCVEVDEKSNSKGKGKIVDVIDVAEEYAMAVFGELAYDSNFSRRSSSFSIPFSRASEITSARFFNPFYRLTERLTPSGRRFRDDVKEVKKFGRELVGEMTGKVEDEEVGNKEEEDGDMRGLLLKELIKAHGGEAGDEGFLADACMNFLTAGKDTTAQALAWLIYELLLHPTWIPLIRREINLHPSAGSTISYHDLTSPSGPFKCTNAFISEVLRLRPPVPIEILQNTLNEVVILPDQTVVQPKENVLWSPWIMGRSTRIWGDDARTFRPERWMDEDTGEKGTRHPLQKTAYEFPVFHGGPRSCLGKPLARAELAYSLVAIVGRYDLEPAWDITKEKGMGGGLLSPVEGGVPVRVRRRRKLRV